MELIVNGDNFDTDLSGEFLEGKLKSLSGKGDSFIILAKEEMTYMQASGCFHDGFMLEYQDGSIDRHFTCVTEPLSNSQVVSAFKNYLAGNDQWERHLDWEREDLGNHHNSIHQSRISLSWVVVALVCATVAVWYLVNNL